MKPFILGLAIVALIALGVAHKLRPEQTHIASSTVLISDEVGHGSGVHIGSGFVLTAAHVLQGHDMMTVTDSEGNAQPGIVLWSNKTYDVALIQIDKTADIASSKLDCHHLYRVGDKITARGNPGELKLLATFGRISGPVVGDSGLWKLAFLADITIGPGMSGGPVFDDLDRVIGLTVGVALANLNMFSQSIYGESYIVPSSAACLLMAEARR